MASWETLLAFATLTVLVAYFPGPALLYTAAQTISHGRKAGLMAMLGIHIGCYVHVFAAAFGLSAVFKHVPELYVAVKLAGALYLVWLGIGMIPLAADRSGRAGRASEDGQAGADRLLHRRDP